jgi:16S rRNA (guanine527-N7)-methyltransferase
VRQFHTYLAELKRWNARVNLTALRTDRDIIIKHFLDSLAVLPYLGEPRSLADLGSGAGFPGLALKLLRPQMSLTLVESRGKKAAFLEYLAAVLKLAEVTVAPVRLTLALARNWGPRFDAVVSRAALPLGRFLELAAPVLHPGGLALALKGPQREDMALAELSDLAAGLGLRLLPEVTYFLPFSGEARRLVLARA